MVDNLICPVPHFALILLTLVSAEVSPWLVIGKLPQLPSGTPVDRCALTSSSSTCPFHFHFRMNFDKRGWSFISRSTNDFILPGHFLLKIYKHFVVSVVSSFISFSELFKSTVFLMLLGKLTIVNGTSVEPEKVVIPLLVFTAGVQMNDIQLSFHIIPWGTAQTLKSCTVCSL